MEKLTKYERETIINYNDAEDTATLYTCNKALMRKIDSFCKKNQMFVKAKSDLFGTEYTLPKKCVSIRLPRIISEEKRKDLARMAKERFKKTEE